MSQPPIPASAPKREPVDVQKLRELCNAAEPGPWTVVTHDGRKNIGVESAEVSAMDHGGVVANLRITIWKKGRRDARPSAAFIAAARTALPALLDEIEDLRKLRDVVAAWKCPFHADPQSPKTCACCYQIDAAMRGEPKEGM